MKNKTAILDILKILKKFEPLYLLLITPRLVINASLPILLVYFPKLIIEHLIIQSSYFEIIIIIIVFVVILLTVRLIQIYLQSVANLLSERFALKLKNEIADLSTKITLEDLEKTDFKDLVVMGKRASNITQTMDLVQGIFAHILTIISLSYIVSRIDLLFFTTVAGTFIIKSLFVYFVYRANKKVRKSVAKNTRILNYLNRAAYNNGSAKEIRINNLQEWFLNKVNEHREEMIKIQYKDFNRHAFTNIIMKFIIAIQSALVLWILVAKHIKGVISLADFTLCFGSVAALTLAFNNISDKIGAYKKQVLNFLDYKKIFGFINNKSQVLRENSELKNNKFNKINIEFENVSFKYPETEKYVLKKINLSVTEKQKLLIVGLNGAGKTTLIKLLCKFYKPTEGKIYVNGININSISDEIYYNLIGAVFQDYINFSFTIKENISFSENGNTDLIEKAAKKVGLNSFINSLKEKYDTYLYKNYDPKGIEFSGGQAQKLAIARTIYKNAPLLILDEPTSSLDPISENEIYNNFLDISQEKTTIFISHKLLSSMVVDKIIVLKDGEIIEQGTHKELLLKDGFYSEMYTKQTEGYKK